MRGKFGPGLIEMDLSEEFIYQKRQQIINQLGHDVMTQRELRCRFIPEWLEISKVYIIYIQIKNLDGQSKSKQFGSKINPP